MTHSTLMDYLDKNYKSSDNLASLPLFHSCEGSTGIKIIETGALTPQTCSVFNKKLLYFFYGKPAYPVAEKFSKTRTSAFLCPVCFIVNPEKITIHEIYPFDTGAFCSNKYSDFFPRNIELINYQLDSNLDTIKTYISTLFGDNDNYIDGRCIQTDDNLMEIELLIKLLNATGAFEIDERANTIEILSTEQSLIEDVVECIILPNSLLRDPRIKDYLSTHNIQYKTYRFRTLTKPDRYNEAIFHLAMEYINERSI